MDEPIRNERVASLSRVKRELLSILLNERRQAGVPGPLTTSREDDGGPRPLSFAQQRIWFMEQLEPSSGAYHLAAAIRLRGTLDVAALAASLTALVARHEVLRTTFDAGDGEPVQVIGPATALPLPVVALTGLSGAAREAAVVRHAAEEARRPFDLRRGPPVRATLLRLDATEAVLLLTLHHIVCDAWSMSIVSRELAAFYDAAVRHIPAVLPPLPIRYADYAAWQRGWLQGEVLARQIRYWQEQLGGAPAVLRLPADRPRPPQQSFRGASRPVVVSAALTARLKELSQQEQATPFMTLLAAFQTWLAITTGQDDVIVGTDTANRPRVETEGVVGFFVNQLVLRTRFGGNPTFRNVLRRVRTTALDAYAHQDLPFEMLVQALKPKRSPQYAPLFQAKIVLQNVPTLTLTLPGVELTPLRLDRITAQLDLILNLADSDNGFVGLLEYNTDLFDTETAARMVRDFDDLLTRSVAAPDSTVRDLAQQLTDAARARCVPDARADATPAVSLVNRRRQAVRVPVGGGDNRHG